MLQVLGFSPAMADWWQDLKRLRSALGRVQVWTAAAHPRRPELAESEQHPTVTLVLALRGVVRVEGATALDLHPGDALVLHAGAWHRHHPLRPGSVCFRQGFITGRSDWHLAGHDLLGMAGIPTEPSRTLLERLSAQTGAEDRRATLGELVHAVIHERTTPISLGHPALLRMELALYHTLHLERPCRRVVQASGLSRAQAYRLAREHWGVGLSGFHRSLQLALARDLLAHGLDSGEAAHRAGFPSAQALRLALRRAARLRPPSGSRCSPSPPARRRCRGRAG